MLYKIDINSKKVVFKYDLNSNNSIRLDLSNLTVDNQNNIILVGINNIQSTEKNIPFISNGWFISKVNPNGNLLSKKIFPFKEHQLIRYKNKKDDDLKHKYINFQKIDIKDDKIILIGENIRVLKAELYTQHRDHTSSISGWVSQRYGFSSFELTTELEEVNSKFKPQLYVSSKNKFGTCSVLTTQKMISNTDALVLFSNKSNLYTSLAPDKIQLNLDDYFYTPSNTVIITKEKNDNDMISFYKTYLSIEKEKEFIRSCKKNINTHLEYFFQSTKVAIEFYSDKKGFSISKIII